MFASADKFDEWFSMGDAKNKEAEAEVVQQLHKVRIGCDCHASQQPLYVDFENWSGYHA